MSCGIAEKEELINARLQQYHQHIITIAELFKNVLRQIEVTTVDDDQNITYSIIRGNLHMRPHANAPLRPMRLCIVGPCGSGKSTQSKIMAKHYGLVHVNVSILLRNHQRAMGMPTEEIPLEYVSDEELCELVGKRLSELDCIRKGWAVDGFPRTQRQAEYLRQAHFWPSRLGHLRASEEEIVNRVSGQRRIDPVTSAVYYRLPTNDVVQQRLVQAPHDKFENVKERYKMYAENINTVIAMLPRVSFTVNADEDIPLVSKNLQTKMDLPLPSELAQDAKDADDA